MVDDNVHRYWDALSLGCPPVVDAQGIIKFPNWGDKIDAHYVIKHMKKNQKFYMNRLGV